MEPYFRPAPARAVLPEFSSARQFSDSLNHTELARDTRLKPQSVVHSRTCQNCRSRWVEVGLISDLGVFNISPPSLATVLGRAELPSE